VTILSPPRDIPSWHHRALFFRDPEDNVIELYAEV
jgi:glyoxylase I family protein